MTTAILTKRRGSKVWYLVDHTEPPGRDKCAEVWYGL